MNDKFKNRVKALAKKFVLVFIFLVFAEQILLQYLDYRATWQDEEFRKYLADPGPRRNNHKVYDCQYRPIAIVYRYRLCIMSFGETRNDAGVERKVLTLYVIGVKGFFSPYPEEHGDRETWDSKLIWELDDNLNVIEDRRKGRL